MKKGTRVRVSSSESSLRGMEGTVVDLFMDSALVRLDGLSEDMFFLRTELEVIG